LTAPAEVIEIDELEEPPESDPGGVASGVVRRDSGAYRAAQVHERSLAEALTLAARAGRWDVVAHLAASRTLKP
jgi:hypothetical protein